ncbi:hypothetical protein BJV82DRAFT_269812 [Fennellomyces sp. T-0311]|nr:hypothetical protein BJV82DRAFT_269812 [Fennellomyces sp. T-0311]
MDANYGATRFTSASNLQIDTIQLSGERLEDATRHLAERIPGRENLTKVMKALKRSGLGATQTSTTLAQILNSKKEHACPVCLSSMKLHKYRREGELKTVNGALRCTNIRCPCHRNSTYGRDDAAAFNIAIRGLSIAISKDNTPLPAPRRNPQDPYQINPNMEIPSV